MKALAALEYKALSILNPKSIKRLNYFAKKVTLSRKIAKKKAQDGDIKDIIVNYLFLNELRRRHVDYVLCIGAICLLVFGLQNFFVDFEFNPKNLSLISAGFFLEYADLLIKFPSLR